MAADDFIIKAFKKLNNALKNNEIIVLDFSHFSSRGDDEKNHDIHFKFVSSKSGYNGKYKKYIQAAIDKETSIWRKYKQGNQRKIYNFENDNSLISGKPHYAVERTELLNKKIRSDFSAEDHLLPYFPNPTGLPGKCMVIYAENHGGAQSLVYVLLKNKIDTAETMDATEISSEDFLEFDKILKSLLLHEMVESLANEKASSSDQIETTATRAALSQMLSRNMAHNLGAHALNNLTNVTSLIKEKNDERKAYMPSVNFKDVNDEVRNDETELIGQLATFNHYVKCRMDYLSDITFETPVMHTNKYVFGELFKDLDRVRLLLNNISGLGKNFPFTLKFCLNGELITKENDFLIALPNDLLGCQAIYNIIENVIRNTAKHNHEKKTQIGDVLEPTIFTVNFKPIIAPQSADEQCWYEVEIFDDIKIPGEKILTKEQSKRYNKLVKRTSKGPVKQIDYLVARQNQKINNSILDEDKRLRNHSLGLLEMEACAAYLRKLVITDIEKNEYLIEFNESLRTSTGHLNILKAFNKDGALGYRFFVSKPTEFLFVGDFNLDKDRQSELFNMGILVKTEAQLLSALKSNEQGRGAIVFNHPFLIYEGNATFYENYKTRLPARVVSFNEEGVQKLSKESFQRIEHWVWKQWFEKKSSAKGYNEIKLVPSYQLGNQVLTEEENRCYFIAITLHNSTKQNLENFALGKLQAVDVLSSNALSKLPDIQNKRELLDYMVDLRNDGLQNEITKFKLFDAYQSRVLVVDERIQRSTGELYLDLSVQKIFSATHVDMPWEIDLSAGNFKGNIGEQLESFLNSKIVGSKDYDFLVIHYSILERMYGSGDARINEQLKNWSKSTRVIVTSGRGKPNGLPSDEVCFLNLSSILNSFTEVRSKYSINYLLNSARK